jgi:acyl-CoA reductase-like NAD-dependent aldehyde dehydrogenase
MLLDNFIGGKFVPSTGNDSIDVLSPSDNSLIAKVPLSSASDFNQAVAVAKIAFENWKNLTIKQRAAIMFKFHSLIDTHSVELSSIIVQENGKNTIEALADVAKGNETVEWATSLPQLAAGKILEVSKGITCQENRIPLGVVAAIVPFNFPGTFLSYIKFCSKNQL